VPGVPDHDLLHAIGRGAYGEVWLARHTRLGTLRAVKIVRHDHFGEARPFQREFDGIRRYEPISRGHPNLVAILHVGGTDDCFYYVMELADRAKNPNSQILSPKEIRNPNAEGAGEEVDSRASGFGFPSDFDIRNSDFYSPHTLRSELKQHGALSIDRVLEIGHALASALAHLHANGLVHRDVKPSNVIFVAGVPKLADIGLVASVDDSRSFVGTEGYIPPEGPGTPSADCYGLGKLLYELSTGKDRTAWPEPAADLATHPDHERLLELNAILHRACAPDLRQRYPAAEQLREDLTLLLRGKSVRARHRRVERWAGAKKGALALVLLTVLVVSSSILARKFSRSRSDRGFMPSVELGRVDEGPRSTNETANALCAHAMLLMRADDNSKMGESYTNLVEAIRLDPNFAKPYVALFEMQIREDFVGMPGGRLEEMRKLAAKLKELAPNLAATHTAVSFLQWADWRFDEALKSCEKAISVNPNYEFTHTHYGFLLTKLGQLEKGREQLLEAEKLEPSKAVIQVLLGHNYYVQRDYTKAMEQYRKAIRFHSDYALAHGLIGRVYRARGQYREAINELEKSQMSRGADEVATKEFFNQLRNAFIKGGGATGYWLEQLNRTQRKPDGEFYWKAVVQVQLGHTNQAFQWLNKSFTTREAETDSWDHPIDDLLFDECWDGLHNDPRFEALVDKIGFTKIALRK